MSEKIEWVINHFTPILLGTLLIGGMGLFISWGNEDIARQSLVKDLGAIEAIINSPAIIIRIDTLSSFKIKQTELKTDIYYSGYTFYLIPDSKLGYAYTPQYSFSIIGPPELTNP